MRAKYLLAIALAGTFSLATTFADQIGDKAKPLTISEWVKGAKNVDVTDGKNIYVVEFWATWCPPCRTSIPHLTKLQKAYKDKGVVFVGVSNEKLETVEHFVKEQGDKMDYTVAVDRDRATSKDYMTAYGQNGIPCAFIINKGGQIAWVGHPMSMEKTLEQIQSGKYDLAAAIAANGILAGGKKMTMNGTYGYDVAFFKAQKIECTELVSEDEQARVLVVPGYQARVMTSSARGAMGDSFGWINHALIRSGQISPKFNAFGGEERLWFGPEGGKFSWYFKPGQEQTYENWNVPALIDTESFDLVKAQKHCLSYAKETTLTNASGTEFQMGIERTISLLDKKGVESLLEVNLPPGLNYVAYQTENKLTNKGSQIWTKENGLPSIWLLGMFNPSLTTTVFIPYKKTGEGTIVNDEYFGKVPADRLLVNEDQGMIYFKIDGKCRTKIGLPKGRAKGFCGSYDTAKQVLTLLKYNQPQGEVDYVNGKWGEQEDAFNGDVINSYNDGPTEDGTIMGPFYEIETSSPGAALKPGETLSHTQQVFHFQGDSNAIGAIVQRLFGIELKEIAVK